jgi:hypothetical protein
MRARLTIILAAAGLAATLAYLRDPPWLARMEYGLREWEKSADGMRYRWTGGHASFFVSADASTVTIPTRTTFDAGDPSVMVSFTIDDRLVDRFVLADDGWQIHTLRLPLPPQASRRLRRIDVRVDRLRDGNRGVQLGEISVLPLEDVSGR